jgi:hypothetical protein
MVFGQVIEFAKKYSTLQELLEDRRALLILGSVVVEILLFVFVIWKIVADDARDRAVYDAKDPLSEENLRKGFEKDANSYKSGKSNDYEWTQNEEEFEVRLPIGDDIKTPDVDMLVKPFSFELRIQGKDYLIRKFPQEVAPSDCIWNFDRVGNSRIIEINIRKKRPSKANDLWEGPFIENATNKSVSILELSSVHLKFMRLLSRLQRKRTIKT